MRRARVDHLVSYTVEVALSENNLSLVLLAVVAELESCRLVSILDLELLEFTELELAVYVA